MAFDRYTNETDNCKPPVCPDDVTVVIGNITCDGDHIVTVEWTVTDIYNRGVSSNVLYWGCDIINLDNINSYSNSITSTSTTQPYRAVFDASSCNGILYFIVKSLIKTSYFYSEPKAYDTAFCGNLDSLAVPATWCDDAEVMPEYYLYVTLSSIASLPFVFSYANKCWEIESVDNPISVDDIPEGADLVSTTDSFNTCEECIEQLDCPGAWTELPESAQTFEGERVGTYYIEYQTYTVPDSLYIVSNFDTYDFVLPQMAMFLLLMILLLLTRFYLGQVV